MLKRITHLPQSRHRAGSYAAHSVRGHAVRLLITAVWVCLFGLLLKRDIFIDSLAADSPSLAQTIASSQSEEYFSIYFGEEKIGHSSYRYEPAEDQQAGEEQTGNIRITQEAELNLTVANSIQHLEMQLSSIIDSSSHLQNFSFSFTSPYYKMNAEGKVNGTEVQYRLDTGSATINETLRLSRPPMLPTSRRAYLLHAGLQSGEKRKVPRFDPFTLSGHESVVEYIGLESQLINGRVARLHHFTENVSGMHVSSWLNDEGVVVKEESPAGFIFIREPKFKALAAASSNKPSMELLSSVAIVPKGNTVPIAPDIASARYLLSLPDDAELDLDGGRQSYSQNILTIQRESLFNATNPNSTLDSTPDSTHKSVQDAVRVKTPLTADKAADNPADNSVQTTGYRPEDLAPTSYIQSAHPSFVKLASQLAETTTSSFQKATVLAEWVYENVEKKPVLGLPDALTVLKNRSGDCNEHAALFAALGRAAGLPTRIAAGVTFLQGAFYYHAWNEVWINGQWISVDTTTNQIPADLGHIRLVQGDLHEQLRLGALLGKLGISVLE